jgi:hypothetical protein
MVTINEDDYLAHYGTPRRSGRYPWGSGDNVIAVPQRNSDFLGLVRQLRAQGLTDNDIMQGMGMKSTEFRARRSIARHEERQAMVNQAYYLKYEKGLSNTAGAERMGVPESTFRNLIKPGAADRAIKLVSTVDALKRLVEEKGYLDVGAGEEIYLGVTENGLRTALSALKQEGYFVDSVPVPQLGTGKDTRVKVLAAPGTKWVDVAKNKDKIQTVQEFSTDHGRTFNHIQKPLPLNPKRIMVVYGDEGGEKKDGLIFVRPDSPDLSLGDTPYAQVRIQVGDSHYLKGMAIYNKDLPDGVDLVFHTNKSNTGNKLDAMKPLKADNTGKISEELPFGSVVRQLIKDGKVVSVMNTVGVKETSNIEGGWDEWSNTLSSQMLSKQSPKLAKKQLDMTYEQKKREFDEIMALTNPVVKKRMLEDFAEGADAAAVHLKAHHLPRQATKVILPISSLRDTEVYAPTFRPGEEVALIRYPHAGTFEIPQLTVNNNNREAKRLLGDARDAIGINHKVAQHLSGADFDGDTVIVIPNPGGSKVKADRMLKQLQEFDPKSSYPSAPGAPKMTAKTKGIEMGKVSNLITDMTIRQAPHDEIIRAVRHSMAVIDAEKHPIDWKYSARVNNIAELSRKYQTPFRDTGRAGASTLISRARSDTDVPQLQLRKQSQGGPIDRKTGELVYVPTGRKKYDYKTGKMVPVKEKRELLTLVKDARELSSGTPIEAVYASHSNRLKGLANQARLESLKTPRVKISSSAKKTYKEELNSLDQKLTRAKANAPRERQAQIIANTMYRAQLQANPGLEYSTQKKLKYQTLDTARTRVGAKKDQIVITQAEWDAIQHGAVSTSKLNDILKHADPDKVKALATPRVQKLMTSTKTSKAKPLLAAGLTRAEVADRLGVSLSTLDLATNE